MSQTLKMRKLENENKRLKKELTYLKKRGIDLDTYLTPREKREIKKAQEEYRKGKFVTHAQLMSELGLGDD